MSTEHRCYVDEEWPHGLRCAACHELFVEGQPISERLDSMVDEIPICIVVCVGCAMSGAAVTE